jgi:hypothetical protein
VAHRQVFGLRISTFGLPLLLPVPSIPWGVILAEVAVLCAGLAVPYLLMCLVLWWAGAFHQFFFWTISYAAKYALAVSPVNMPDLLKATLGAVVGPDVVLWTLPWLGALLIWSDKQLDLTRRSFLIALLLFSVASVCVGFYFRGHYFILLLPAMALWIGMTVSRALRLMRGHHSTDVMVATPLLLLFVVGLLASLVGNGITWFALSATEASQAVYHTSLFTEAVKVANEFRANTSKNARIAVIGSEPEIYFYAARRAATAYIYMYPLMEDQPYAPVMQEEMISQIERARPEAAVYVEDDLSWLKRSSSHQRLREWWKAYAATNMEPVSMLKLEDASEESAGPEPQPQSGKYLLTYQRKNKEKN